MFDAYRGDRSAATTALFDLTPAAADLPAGPRYDEMIDAAGGVRPAWDDLVAGYAARGDDRLRTAAGRLATSVRDAGVVYNRLDGDHTVADDWRIDAVPLVVDGADWAALEKALTQRSMLLDLVLRDLYGDQKLLRAGLIPPQMVFGHPGYVRKAARLGVAGPHALFVHAVDLGRTADGRFVAYADRTQAPSGIGFAIADRRLLSRTFPQLFQASAPRPMTTFAGTLRLALLDYAPPGVDDPTVAVLSPGSMSETAFDQAYLASVLGLPLVEGADLTVRDGTVYMRSLGRYKRVDVLLRRVDAAFADPLDLRTDSRLGVTGLVEAISRGTVTVVNTLGSGVLENPALHTVLDRLAPALLDEDLLMESVPTFWGGEDTGRAKLVADLESLALSNIRTGEDFLGPELATAQRVELADRIRAQTWQWVGRDLLPYSLAPTMTSPDGRTGAVAAVAPGSAGGVIRAAGVSVRAFSVAQGPTYAVMPGGLGSVLADGAAGAALKSVAAKDVWVTSTDIGGHVSRRSETRADAADVRATPGGRLAPTGYSDVAAAASPRVLADMFWFGRHGERVELITRLAQVARERYQDFQYRPWMLGTAAVPRLLHAVGVVTGTAGHLNTAGLILDDAAPPSPEQVGEAIGVIAELTASRTVPGSVGHAVDRLVAGARAVRDQMSTSTWMVLAPVDRAITDLADQLRRIQGGAGIESDDGAVDLGPELARTHEIILHGVLGLAGLQAESMVHDAGWLMMDLGRRIERTVTLADLTRALFAVAHDTDVEQALLESYLAANESSVIYRRRNRGLYRAGAVAELLFFDESNPRALIYQLDRMRADLVALPDSLRTAGAERLVEEMTAELRRSDPAGLVADGDGRRPALDELMTTLRTGARELSDLLGQTRFAPPRQPQPIWGPGGGEVR
ncbi:circularly permuted type 2 ATP-grasp protein [Gordonia sinesedis]